MFKNKKKKFLFSLFALPLLTSYGTFFVDTNKSSLIKVVNNSDKSNLTDTSINIEDAYPVAETTIKNLSDYIVSYEDNNIQPVNENNAVVGMTYDFTTLTYTTYSGLLLWSSNLTKNPLIKNYYATYYKVNNIGAYRVNYFAYQKSTGLLFVLFGDKTKTNQVIFAIDIYTGMINIPNQALLKKDQIIAKVTDNSSFIFFNSLNEIIVTSAGKKADVNKTTKIFRYANKTIGFADRKLDIDLPTALDNEDSVNDLLLSIIPGTNGTNYGYYIYGKRNYSNDNNLFNVKVQETSTTEFTTKAASFNYYIMPLNDDLSNKNRSFKVVCNSATALKWGYVGKNENELPEFDNIYKRIFKLENASNANSTYLFALIDSYWKPYDSYLLFSDNGKTMGVSASRGFGPDMNGFRDVQLEIKASDFKENEKVLADSWDFNTFGYDNESNILYFSLSGQKINTTNNTKNGYLSKMGYFEFVNNKLSIKSSNFETENEPYNLYSVGFESYSSSDNYYMGKQLNKANPIWLSRSNEQNDYTKTSNSNISFSELSISNINLIEQIKGNKLFDESMPDNITNSDLNKLISSLNVTDSVKLTKISSNNSTGLISLQVNINHTNNFGDNIQNGNTNYVFKLDIYGYSLQKDFIFKFITTDMVNIGFNEKINKINEIKASTGPSGITKTQILTYFLNANILDKNNNPLKIEYDWITLNPNDELGYLLVEINLPADKFPTGFSPDSLSATAVYKDFWVHVDPLPPDNPINPSETPSKSENNFMITDGDAQQIGIISSGVIGVTLLFVVLFLFLFFKHRKQVKKINGELTIEK